MYFTTLDVCDESSDVDTNTTTIIGFCGYEHMWVKIYGLISYIKSIIASEISRGSTTDTGEGLGTA